MSWVESPTVETYNYAGYRRFNLSHLAINQYYIVFVNELAKSFDLYTQHSECYNCPPRKSYITIGEDVTIPTEIFSARYSEAWYFQDTNTNELHCKVTPDVAEFGIYEFNMTNCHLKTLVEPVNIYMSILTVILIYLAVAVVIVACVYVYNRKPKQEGENNEPKTKKERIKSIDTFRGLCITLMILVNYGGGGYNFLSHATWNGLTIADVVFPWFLWIMGLCIPISIKSAKRRGDRHIFRHVLKRSCILFMLGIIVNGIDYYELTHQNVEYMRIFGVLQRFGLCYFVVATTCLIFLKPAFPETPRAFCDIFFMLPQWICALVCVGIYSAVAFALKVPDCPEVGYLGPGGFQGDWNDTLATSGNYINCTGGAIAYVDRLVLGEYLMYKGKDLRSIYGSIEPVDPEGIMGTFNAIFQVFLGVQAGVTLLMYKDHLARVGRWLMWAVITGVLGGVLCGFSQEDGVIPINKTLWSLSFVFVTSFFAYVVLSLLYVIVDWGKFWSGKPFLFAGMNSIILYVGQALTYSRFPFQWGLLEPTRHFQLLAQAVWGTMCWWIVAYWLYKIKFFLSI